MYLDTLLFGRRHFLGLGGHILSQSPIEDDDVLGALAQGRPGCIDGGVSTPDNSHPAAHLDAVAEIYLPQELHPAVDPLELFTRNPQALALVGADSQVEHIILLAQVLKGDVFPHPRAGPKLDPEGPDIVDLPL